MESAEDQLAIANIRLLHMAGSAAFNLGIILYGIAKAHEDPSFLKGALHEVLPHLDDRTLNEIFTIKRDADLDQVLKGGRAASLIFMHAGIESCLVSVARAIAKISPNSFLPLFKGKQILLADAISGSKESILSEQIESYLAQMDRQSLVEKTRALFRLINNQSLSSQGKFDEAKVRRIEGLRNHCAHGRVDLADFSTVSDDIDYLREIGEFFIDAAAKTYNIPYKRASMADLGVNG